VLLIEKNPFLSDPSPIIGYACQQLTHSLTDSVTFSKLDWCNPGVWRCQLKTCWCCNCCWWGSCWQQLLQILKLRFGKKKLNFCLYFEHKVWSRFWSSGKIWSWSLSSFSLLMFCRGYEIKSWSRFGQDFEALWSFLWRCWCLVEVEVDAWSRFWRWNLIKICVWTCDMNSTLGSVVPLAMFSF